MLHKVNNKTFSWYLRLSFWTLTLCSTHNVVSCGVIWHQKAPVSSRWTFSSLSCLRKNELMLGFQRQKRNGNAFFTQFVLIPRDEKLSFEELDINSTNTLGSNFPILNVNVNITEFVYLVFIAHLCFIIEVLWNNNFSNIT